MKPYQSKNRIKAELPMEKLLSYYGFEKVARNLYWCKLHPDKEGGKPSLILHPKSDTITCASQACFQGDDIFGVIAKMERWDSKRDFSKILEKAAQIASIIPNTQKTEKLSPKRKKKVSILDMTQVEEYHQQLPQRIKFYLNNRGIGNIIINQHKIGWNGKAITIPIFNKEGDFSFFKYRKDPENPNKEIAKYWCDKGTSAELYGWKNMKNRRSTLIICEGELDRLLLESKGFPAVTSTGGVGIFKEEWAEGIKKIPEIYICFDNDLAGRKGAENVAKLIPQARIVRLPKMEEGKKDITEYFQSGHTVEEFRNLLGKAQALPKIEKGKKRKKKKRGTVYACSAVLDDGSIAEMVYDPKKEESKFAFFKNGKVDYKKSINLLNGKILKPIPASRTIVKSSVVLFPTQIEEYGSESQLLEEIENFVHKYVDMNPVSEKISVYYSLFTWIYDRFNEVPNLRYLGGWGSGKTRAEKTVGSICYKPIFAGGAITSAPIFRILQEIKGTLIIDEADFRDSDSWSDIVKILNCGIEKGFPVLRCVGKKYDPRGFEVFGPKIIASRHLFKDQAFESRCLLIEMEVTSRGDIPLNLPDNFWEEVTHLRNKLLLWRFRNYRKTKLNPKLKVMSVEPRLNQIAIPLLSVIKEKTAREQIKEFIQDWNKQIVQDRGMSLAGEIVEIIIEILEEKKNPEMQHIADKFNEKYGFDEKDRRQFSARKVGSIIRKGLKLHPKRGKGGRFTISQEEYERVYRLADKFGIKRGLETKTQEELQKEADELASEHPEEFNQKEKTKQNRFSFK